MDIEGLTGEVSQRTTRILIADDDGRVRHALRALIETQSDWTVVGEAASKAEVLQMDEAVRADVVLLDVRLPDASDGLDLIRRLVRERQRLVLAISVRGGLREEALAAGARAFVEKGIDADTFVNALQGVIDIPVDLPSG